MRTFILGLLAIFAYAGDVPSGGQSATAATTTPAIAPDPSAAIIAEGACIYRQRDLDALLLIALRHTRTKDFSPDGKPPVLARPDEDRIRQVLIRALVAREQFIETLAGLPERIPAAARNAIVLDILAFKAEPSGRIPAIGTVPIPIASAVSSTGPLIVRLPPFTITKSIAGSGRRQLTVGLALAFADAAQARAFEAQAPLIQDAVLGAMRSIDPNMFVDPEHTALKRQLTEAIRAKVPTFPGEGLLIPQLEAAVADTAPDR